MKDLNQTKLWTATVTPFNQEGQIDFESFLILLKRQEEAGNGVVILGSTGEALALSLEERKQIVNFTCEQKLNVPVMVGVGGFNEPEVLDWLKFCEAKKIDAYLMVCPLYAKPGPQGQTRWFESLLNSVTKPCMLYNVPSRTGVKLHPTVLTNLKGHKNLWALKEASGSLDDFQSFQAANAGIALYSGEDSLMPFLASMGAKGLVSVSANVWPKATNLYVQMSVELKHEKLFPTWPQASNALFMASNPIPTKVLLEKLKVIPCADTRAPLHISDLTDSTALLAANKAIEAWYQENQN